MNTSACDRFHQGSRSRFIGRLSIALLACAWALPTQAWAVPVTYDEELMGGNISGTLNGKAFSNSYLILEFKADTSTVTHYSIPHAAGYENLTGTATFLILDSSFATVGQGTFRPAARIFISVDNTNGGIGFGSFSVPKGQTGFPGEPVYPGAVLVPASSVPNVTRYNLKTNISLSDYQIGCVGFPGTCQPGLRLPTTAGPLVLNQITVGSGYFSTTTSPAVAMPALSASVAQDAPAAASAAGAPLNHFQVDGPFSVDASGGAFNPAAESVTLQLGGYRATIPPGWFKGSKQSGYDFEGQVDDVVLRISFKAEGETDYTFHVEGTGAGVPSLPKAVLVKLIVGQHLGRTITAGPRP
jgi:hypothetical protein